jgi:hypothetical protein
LVIGVVGGPAPPTRACVRALIAIVPRVLTVTLETVGVEWQLVLAQGYPRGRVWFPDLTTLKTVFSFTVFRVSIC